MKKSSRRLSCPGKHYEFDTETEYVVNELRHFQNYLHRKDTEKLRKTLRRIRTLDGWLYPAHCTTPSTTIKFSSSNLITFGRIFRKLKFNQSDK